LLDFVFPDTEIALLQAGDELPAIIHDGDVQDDKAYVLLDGIVRRLRGSLRGRRLRGALGAKRRSGGDSQDCGRNTQGEGG
jgi:hypothetical protein